VAKQLEQKYEIGQLFYIMEQAKEIGWNEQLFTKSEWFSPRKRQKV